MKLPHLIAVMSAVTTLGLTTGCDKPADMDEPSPSVPVAPATNALNTPSGSVAPPSSVVSQAVTRTAGEFANVPKTEFQARLRQDLKDLN